MIFVYFGDDVFEVYSMSNWNFFSPISTSHDGFSLMVRNVNKVNLTDSNLIYINTSSSYQIRGNFLIQFSFIFQVSVFEAPAWQYNNQRKQFYLHEFLIEQPDFNYRSPAVVQEMKVSFFIWSDLQSYYWKFIIIIFSLAECVTFLAG